SVPTSSSFPTPSSPRKRGSMDVAVDSSNTRSRGNDEQKEQPLSLVFAIPDHPWVDTADGAAVRIAMTVGKAGMAEAGVKEVVAEQEQGEGEIAVSLLERRGRMFADLKVGANVTAAIQLRANSSLSNRGVIPHGEGMTVNEVQAAALGLGRIAGMGQRIRP